MHSHGYCHNDIRPRNFLVKKINGNNVIAIADFDTSVDVSKNHFICDGFKLGEISFWSPEKLKGFGYTAAVDIFAMGIMFSVLIYNKHPYLTPQQSKRIKRDILAKNIVLYVVYLCSNDVFCDMLHLLMS